MNSGKEFCQQRSNETKQHRHDDNNENESSNLSNSHAGTALYGKKIAALLVKCSCKYNADQHSKQISNLFESALVTTYSRTKGENDNN